VPPKQRTLALERLRAGKTRVLVASDAMARGMDVEGVGVVVNYDPPSNLKGYVHRVGRTARAGKSGTSYTLLKDSEVHHFKVSMAKAGKAYRPLELPAQQAGLARLAAEYERALAGLQWTLQEEREGRLAPSAPMEEVEQAYGAHLRTLESVDDAGGSPAPAPVPEFAVAAAKPARAASGAAGAEAASAAECESARRAKLAAQLLRDC